ncbi:hypothetical protein FQA39_LY07728 [Lamprigera yunnana]|nr:hypothetical protein FQA39_LY07728 [Lamprigera yunnana]
MLVFLLVMLFFRCDVEGGVPFVEDHIFNVYKPLFDCVEKQFRNQYNILAVTGDNDQHTVDFLDWVLYNYETTSVIIFYNNHEDSERFKTLAKVVIVVLKNVDEVGASLDRLLRRSFFSYACYIYFVLINGTFHSTYQNLGIHMWEKNILNVFFVSFVNDVEVIGYNPFTNEIENYTTIENYPRMFNDKARKLNGYEITVGIVEDVPRCVYHKSQVYSTDKIIMQGVLKLLNGTINEKFYSNESFPYLNNLVLNGELECTYIRQFVFRKHFGKIQFSYPYHIDAAVIMIPSPKYLPNYLNILFVFRIKLWTCLVGICILITVVTSIIDKASIDLRSLVYRESSIFQTLRALMNLPSTEINESLFSKKLLFLFCVWLTLFFQTLFKTTLTSALIKPQRYEKITTLEGLGRSEFDIYVFPKNKFLRKDGRDLLTDKFKEATKSEIVNMIMSGNEAHVYVCTSIECADILLRRTHNKFKRDVFYTLKEVFVPGHRAYAFSNKSCYLEAINRTVGMRNKVTTHLAEKAASRLETYKYVQTVKQVSIVSYYVCTLISKECINKYTTFNHRQAD